jgi:putative addiction module component (TIGR02574 family)
MKIQELTISERIILAEALWDSVIEEESTIELTAAQKKELERRLSALELDGDEGSEWSEVRARITSKP